MPNKKPIHASDEQNSQLNEFFKELVETVVENIKIDHLLMTENVAPEETKEFYEGLMSGNAALALKSVKKTTTEVFIKEIVKDYLIELAAHKRKPLKLALGLSDSKILIWSVIKDSDEEMEDALLLSEAKVNAKYHPFGFYLNSTIVEKSDNLKTPPHYLPIIK